MSPRSALIASAWAPCLACAVDLSSLSLEELRDVRVESVARRAQPLLDAPASIVVIPGDDIRRLRIGSLAEALRLAPTLEVAALDNRQYAVSARGFNSSIANKLLVLVDGRTVYSPLFSGTFWDAQDFVADDIDQAREDLEREWPRERRQRWAIDSGTPATDPADVERDARAEPSIRNALHQARLRAERDAIVASIPPDVTAELRTTREALAGERKALVDLDKGKGHWAETKIADVAKVIADTERGTCS